jgi:hypothetical protein
LRLEKEAEAAAEAERIKHILEAAAEAERLFEESEKTRVEEEA